MYPITSILAAAANRALHGQFAGFSSRHLALRAGGRQLVWRIDAAGRLLAVSPLITPDCLIEWKNGAVHISGDGELFRQLSEVWRESDWLAIISRMTGERLAPSVLHGLECAAARGKSAFEKYLPAEAMMTEYRAGIHHLNNRVIHAGKRIDRLPAHKGSR